MEYIDGVRYMTYKSKKEMVLFNHKEYPLDTHVSNFPISAKARNTLKNMDIWNLRELLCADTDKYYESNYIPNCGSQTREEIKSFARMIDELSEAYTS